VLNWVEIDAQALRHNVREFRRRIGEGVALAAVVKSNAYGHGALEVARIVTDEAVPWLCVNGLDEAIALRGAGFDGPMLVMGSIPLDRADEAVEHRLRVVVYSPETVDALAEAAGRLGSTVRVHLKVETGTHRQGAEKAAVPDLLERIRATGALRLEGVYTHYANIEDTTDHAFARGQIAAFESVCDLVERELGSRIPIRHSACSAATLLFTETHGDLARVGISLYGLWPSRETFVSCRDRGQPTPDLRPVLTWKTRIAQVKDVGEGSFIGYGCTFRTTRPSLIAVLPVGYHEGYDRRLSGVGHVLVGGRRAPVCGRVCMNMTMVDVTDVPEVSARDEVVLLGTQGEERISAEQIASWCATIPYEIVSRIHPSLPRVVV
jgi:alanine racemase